jgi:hypothetical protein
MSVLELLDQIIDSDINPDDIKMINEKLELIKNKIALKSRPYQSIINYLQSISIDNPNSIVITDEDLY